MSAKESVRFYQRGPEPGHCYDYPLAAGVRIVRNGIVGVTASLEAVPAGHPDAVTAVGLAQDAADNCTGGRGDKRVIVGTGVFEMSVALPDATAADIKSPVYAVADDSLSLVGAFGQKPIGRIDAIDEEGVWVEI